MKRKVLQVIGTLRLGGAETVALNYFKYIDKNKFIFDYLVFSEEEGFLEESVKELGGRIHRIPPPSKGIIKFYKNIRKLIKENNSYDVIHSHPLHLSGLVMKAAHKEKVPIRISHAHSARQHLKIKKIKKIYNFIMRRKINKYSTHYLACSKDAGDYLFGKRKFARYGMVVKNGIDIKQFQYNEIIRNKIRRQYSLEGKFVLGHIGRLSEVKNQTFLLDILKIVKKKKKDVVLLLVGDGPCKNILINKTIELDLQDDVLFLGAKSNNYELLQGMDMLIFPSKYEGLGLVIIEAQAAGLKCMISDTIPKEVDLSNLVIRKPLEIGAKGWAEEIIKVNKSYNRENTTNKIYISGYDLKSVIDQITLIYTAD